MPLGVAFFVWSRENHEQHNRPHLDHSLLLDPLSVTKTHLAAETNRFIIHN